MEKDVIDAIQENEEEINKLKSQNAFMQTIDFSKPVDEETWHKICETPLRTSQLLGILVKNTFPEAEDIVVHCNYVYFTLLGFKVQIPTYRSQGINVDADWYKRDRGTPQLHLSEAQKNMVKYYEALDNGESWRTLAKLRLHYTNSILKYKDWFLPFAWFFKYKWKKLDRNKFERQIKEMEDNLEKRIENYKQERKDMHDKALLLRETVLPMLDKFSIVHRNYNDSRTTISIDVILSSEFPDSATLSNKEC